LRFTGVTPTAPTSYRVGYTVATGEFYLY